MIRSVVIPCPVDSAEELHKLHEVLCKLGFESGNGWNDHRSSGAPLVTSVGSLELVHGQMPADADLLIEVDDVTEKARLAEDLGLRIISPLAETHWNSRLFVIRIGKLRAALFQFHDREQDAA